MAGAGGPGDAVVSESPGRTIELSHEVSQLRDELAGRVRIVLNNANGDTAASLDAESAGNDDATIIGELRTERGIEALKRGSHTPFRSRRPLGCDMGEAPPGFGAALAGVLGRFKN